ncbi:MAG: hypothetical protein IKU07_07025 [Oscillospiraceae bacterium]|nr:hypothetical protein [Oscillospiraceae bacterium]
MKHTVKIIALLLLALLLTGCMRTVDEMYRLPKRPDAYNDLQSSIDSAMADMAYCAPLNGENQQTVQMADLDGDGEQEYLLFAKSTHEKPLRLLVFRNIDGKFVNTDTVESNGSSFDQVEYVDMDGRSGTEIVVGRQLSDQVIRSVTVYTFTDGELVKLMSANYTKFLTTDLDNNNQSELFLLRPGQNETDNGVAELYAMREDVMERYNECEMSQPAEKLKRIITGKLDGGSTAVYTASAAGETALVTDVFAVKEGMLTNIAFSNESGTAVQTLRNYYVYADDIDNDGVVELPSLITMKPMDEAVATENQQLVRWYAMTTEGEEINKMYTYHNFVGGWYMQLQSTWAQRVVVTNTGSHYSFYIWDEGYKTAQKVMTVFVFTAQNRDEQGNAENRFVLHKTESVTYAAFLEPAAEAYGITQESAAYSFRMIQKDWKTGET